MKGFHICPKCEIKVLPTQEGLCPGCHTKLMGFSPKKCPKCSLLNPPTVLICDCGYKFETHKKSKPIQSNETGINGNEMSELSARVRLASEAQPLPKMWIGVLLGIICLVLELAGVIFLPNDESHPIVNIPFAVISYGIWIYWLFCVYKFHEAVDRIPGYQHPITPAKAVAFHFLPLFNIYWIFRWPAALAKFVNWRTQAKIMHGWIIGILILFSVIIFNVFDSFVGAMFLFGCGWYINQRFKRAFTASPVPESAMKSQSYSRILDI